MTEVSPAIVAADASPRIKPSNYPDSFASRIHPFSSFQHTSPTPAPVTSFYFSRFYP